MPKRAKSWHRPTWPSASAFHCGSTTTARLRPAGLVVRRGRLATRTSVVLRDAASRARSETCSRLPTRSYWSVGAVRKNASVSRIARAAQSVSADAGSPDGDRDRASRGPTRTAGRCGWCRPTRDGAPRRGRARAITRRRRPWRAGSDTARLRHGPSPPGGRNRPSPGRSTRPIGSRAPPKPPRTSETSVKPNDSSICAARNGTAADLAADEQRRVRREDGLHHAHEIGIRHHLPGVFVGLEQRHVDGAGGMAVGEFRRRPHVDVGAALLLQGVCFGDRNLFGHEVTRSADRRSSRRPPRSPRAAASRRAGPRAAGRRAGAAARSGSEIAGWPVMLNGCVCWSIAARTLSAGAFGPSAASVDPMRRRGDRQRRQHDRVHAVERRRRPRGAVAAASRARSGSRRPGSSRPLSKRARTRPACSAARACRDTGCATARLPAARR